MKETGEFFCSVFHLHLLFLSCVQHRQRNQPHWLSPCFFLLRCRQTCGSIWKSPEKQKHKEAFGMYHWVFRWVFLNRRKAWRTVSVCYHRLLKIDIPIVNVSLSSS